MILYHRYLLWVLHGVCAHVHCRGVSLHTLQGTYDTLPHPKFAIILRILEAQIYSMDFILRIEEYCSLLQTIIIPVVSQSIAPSFLNLKFYVTAHLLEEVC